MRFVISGKYHSSFDSRVTVSLESSEFHQLVNRGPALPTLPTLGEDFSLLSTLCITNLLKT